MLVIEEHCHWRMSLSPGASLYLGQGVGPGVVRGLAAVAVQVNIPGQVVGRGHHHDAGGGGGGGGGGGWPTGF